MADQQQTGGTPYIGARISLLSNALIRYEGTLYTIDTREATVALQNVKCFGTENRVSGGQSVPASDNTYEFIIFRGKDIKDLHVLSPVAAAPPKPSHNIPDPAIVAVEVCTISHVLHVPQHTTVFRLI